MCEDPVAQRDPVAQDHTAKPGRATEQEAYQPQFPNSLPQPAPGLPAPWPASHAWAPPQVIFRALCLAGVHTKFSISMVTSRVQGDHQVAYGGVNRLRSEMEQVKTPVLISSGILPVNSHCAPGWVTHPELIFEEGKKKDWAWGRMLVVPTTREAEAG